MTRRPEKTKAGEVPLISAIREFIVSARRTVARGVDLIQVLTNFEIGRRIVEYEQQGKKRAGYGREIVKALAERLSAEFGAGFSKRNLDYMRRFYLDDGGRRAGIVQTLSAQSMGEGKGQTVSDQLPFSKSRKTQSVRNPSQQLGNLGVYPPTRKARFSGGRGA